MYEDLKVLKRDNKKVDFNGEKIAVAIKKAFDSREEFIEKYTEDDINKVFQSVLADIFDSYFEKPYIKVEEIQDVIEKILIKLNYKDVYESFSSYREKRAESRKMFLSEPKQHKLLKAIEKITLKQEWSKKNTGCPLDIIYNYGKIISEEFSNAYLLKNNHFGLHESGQIRIDKIEYLSVGTTESCVIDIDKLLQKGLVIDEKTYNTPNDIPSYLEQISLIIKRNAEDQHGNQGINNFDSVLKDVVIQTFKEEFSNKVYDLLDINGFLNLIDFELISKEIFKLDSISTDIKHLYKYSKDVEQIKLIIEKSYVKAIENTNKILYKSLNNFLNNINYKVKDINREVTISIGTDISFEGKMISKNLLLSLEKDSIPRIVFKLKKGINKHKDDPNFDLLELSLKTIMRDINIGFANIDFKLNMKKYNGSNESEVFYFFDGSRVLENILSEKTSVNGRGFLSRTYINLVRIGIRNKTLENGKESFFEELGNIIEIVSEQLYDRFLIQSEKRGTDFQFLIGENIYMDSKGLKQGEKVKKAIKNGLLGIGIIGLDECVNLFNNSIDQKMILDFVSKKINNCKKEFNLNFVLVGPENDPSSIFVDLDKTIYGEVKDVTDKDQYYTYINSANFEYLQNIFDGGISYKVDVDSEEQIIRLIDNTNFGYLVISKKIEE